MHHVLSRSSESGPFVRPIPHGQVECLPLAADRSQYVE
jgi:hypothetical protein